MEIKVRTKDEQGNTVGPISLNYDMPESLSGLVAKFGEGPVADGAIGSFVIAIQNTARRLMVPAVDKTGKVIREAYDQAQIQSAIDTWTPDTKATVRLSALDRATKALDSMSDDERAALLAKLQESMKAKKAA